MNQQQRASALLYADYLDARREKTAYDMETAALLRSLAEEKQAEPVAWRSRHPELAVNWRVHADPLGREALEFDAWEQQPLFANPPAKQEPLTDDEIGAVHDENSSLPDLIGVVRQWPAILSFARLVESACAKKWGVKL